MKKQVEQKYFGSAPEGENDYMQVYTLGINTASANSSKLAQIVLDPRTYLTIGKDENGNTVYPPNDFSDDFINYAEEYFEGSVSIRNAGEENTQFTLDNSLGLTGIDDLKYNDGYYEVVGAGTDINWDGVFDEILAQVIQNTAQVPTQDEGLRGFISYTDPIGEYMEVKEIKALIIGDVIFRNPTRTEVPYNDIVMYTFTGTANNPVYGAQPISNIQILLMKDEDGLQLLGIYIPTELIPLRVTNIVKDTDDNVVSYTHNEQYPMRLIYSVGLKNGVLNDDGTVNVNYDANIDDYIAAHTVDGQVRFYEGIYNGKKETGTSINTGKTIGDAYVTYTPAYTNPFYYVGENTPLYTDEACTERANGTISPDATYYFEIEYYQLQDDGSVKVDTAVVSRPGSSLLNAVKSDSNGYYIEAGGPRLGNLADFQRDKLGKANKSGTAEAYLYLSYVRDEEDPTNPKAGQFKVCHGNNGYVSASLPNGTLTVTKQVVGNPGTDGLKEFTFKITAHYVNGNEAITGTVGGINFENGEGIFTLEAGETKTFSFGSKDNEGISWAVAETTRLGDDWSTAVTINRQSKDSATGTLIPSETQAVTFTNSYTTPTGTLTVQKSANDSVKQFAFTLTAENLKYGDAILIGDNEIPLDAQNSYAFTLGNSQSISFTIPEHVMWTVTEGYPGEHWSTTASINGGESQSTRIASGTMEQGAAQTVSFTNTYTAPGSLVVSKTVEGGDPDAEYTFKVTINGTEKELKLKNGQLETYSGLQAGTNWKVEETGTLAEGWATTVNGTEDKTVSGKIESGEVSRADFVNSAPGKLIVTKKVEGEDAPADAEFNFTLTYGDKTETFVLEADGQEEVTLPAGTQYTVTEDDPGSGWTSVSTNASGTILAGATTKAEFVNTYVKPEKPDPDEPEEPEPDEPDVPVIPVEPEEPDEPVKPAGDGPQLEREDHFGYLVGRTDTEVFPNANMTRAEVATIFFRVLTDESRAEYWSSTNDFSDVSSDSWYNNAVSTMANAGVINGYEDGTFRPNAPITRAEFAAMAVRFYGEVGDYETDSFNDISGTWARNYINRAYELGLVGGYDDGGFHPDANITRAETIKIINGVLERKPDAGHLHEDMKVWDDNSDEAAWYYADIQEATNSHTYDMGAEYETWTGIEPLCDWTALEKEWSDAYGR